MGDLGRGRLIAGAGMAATAARLEPTGWPLAGLLATLIGDPEAMRQGARQWRDDAPADGKKTPSMAELRADLNHRLTRLETDESLRGKLLTQLKEKHAELNRQLDVFDRCRTSVGDGLDSGAALYDAASWVSLSLGGSAMTVAVFSQACKGHAVTFAASRPMIAKAMAGMGRVAQKVVDTMMRTNWKVAGVLTVAGYYYSGVSGRFPGMKAVAADVPNLRRAKLAYPDTGVPDLDMVEPPSMLPPFTL